jgi:hypothetical protein
VLTTEQTLPLAKPEKQQQEQDKRQQQQVPPVHQFQKQQKSIPKRHAINSHSELDPVSEEGYKDFQQIHIYSPPSSISSIDKHLTVKHEPPPRSMSPIKPALRDSRTASLLSQESTITSHHRKSSRVTFSDTRDNTSESGNSMYSDTSEFMVRPPRSNFRRSSDSQNVQNGTIVLNRSERIEVIDQSTPKPKRDSADRANPKQIMHNGKSPVAIAKPNGLVNAKKPVSLDHGLEDAKKQVSLDHGLEDAKKPVSLDYGLKNAKKSINLNHGLGDVKRSISLNHGLVDAKRPISLDHGLAGAKNNPVSLNNSLDSDSESEDSDSWARQRRRRRRSQKQQSPSPLLRRSLRDDVDVETLPGFQIQPLVSTLSEIEEAPEATDRKFKHRSLRIDTSSHYVNNNNTFNNNAFKSRLGDSSDDDHDQDHDHDDYEHDAPDPEHHGSTLRRVFSPTRQTKYLVPRSLKLNTSLRQPKTLYNQQSLPELANKPSTKKFSTLRRMFGLA